MTFIWRPYRDCAAWDDEDEHLSFCRQYRYLIGKTVQTSLIIEMYLPQHVLRQFGEQHDVLVGIAEYARSSREYAWGSAIPVAFATQQIDRLVA